MATVERKIRKRNPNWDDVEKGILRKCLENMTDIIENKCTDTNTNKQKNLAWQKVLQSFNELNGRQRSIIEVKQQWRTMKIEAKKCNYNYKKALKATGGGQKPPTPDPTTVKIMEMLPLEFEEDSNKFDSDTITQNQTVTIEQVSEEYDVINKQEKENQESGTLVSTPILGKRILFNKSPFTLPKKRKCKPDEPNLLQTVKERNAILTNAIEKECNLKINHMTEAHEWAREEHKLKMENLILQNKLLKKQIQELNK